MCLDGVFGNEKLRGDLAIAEAAGDQGEDFELACRDAEGLLVGRIRSEGFEGGGFRGDKHFPHHDRFADGFSIARDAETEPDAEGREEDGDERAVELDGVLDDDEAVFGVLEGGDQEAADEAEDEDMALHDGVVKKYNGDGEEVFSPRKNSPPIPFIFSISVPPAIHREQQPLQGRSDIWLRGYAELVSAQHEAGPESKSQSSKHLVCLKMHPILPPKGARIGLRYPRKRGYGKPKDEAPGDLLPIRKESNCDMRISTVTGN